MNKRIILTAAFFGLTAVLLGAFGSHALKEQVTAAQVQTWEKGIEYQFYHTLALLYLSTFARYKNNLINISYICFFAGIVLFSGSLYLIATKDLFSVDISHFGLITPAGGLFFVLGWIMLFFAALKDK